VTPTDSTPASGTFRSLSDAELHAVRNEAPFASVGHPEHRGLSTLMYAAANPTKIPNSGTIYGRCQRWYWIPADPAPRHQQCTSPALVHSKVRGRITLWTCPHCHALRSKEG
jgi:hypothetical protein